MGEAKRRSAQGLPPKTTKSNGQDTTGSTKSWWPLQRSQADRFVRITTRGAWIGIGSLVLFWVIVRFLGPAAGWWSLSDG